ncbi:hypothetical protein ACOL20_10000 [Aliarcobacter butzleri]|nr:hypothetical protein [Aliarcobacter butzleri]
MMKLLRIILFVLLLVSI